MTFLGDRMKPRVNKYYFILTPFEANKINGFCSIRLPKNEVRTGNRIGNRTLVISYILLGIAKKQKPRKH